jgi:drug/metabolite transporter (DMT)-like permease
MRVLNVFLFAIYTTASVAALVIVKWWLPAAKEAIHARAFFSAPVFMVSAGATLYLMSFLTWWIIVSRTDLSFSYPIAVGLTLVFSSLMAKLVLHESIGLTRMLGIVVILLGIWLITRPQVS